jgi:hypothetical protein
MDINKQNKRQQLLLKLENIIGNECYNKNIQNWGANGSFLGEGRSFRYPITFNTDDGSKIKKRYPDFSLPATVSKTGYYAFGANKLNIIRALDSVIEHLEEEYGLDLESTK